MAIMPGADVSAASEPANGITGGAAFWRLMIPLMITEMVAVVGLVMLYTAVHKLTIDLGGTTTSWLITSYILSSAAAAALLGRIGDVLGRRRILLVILALSSIGALIASFTRDPSLLILSRALQGFAGACMPLCFGIVRERVSAAKVPLGMGLIGGVSSSLAGVGLVMGAMMVQWFDWPVIFMVLAGVSITAFLAILLFLAPDKPADTSSLDDLLGGLLFIPAAVGLLMGIEKIGRAGVSDPAALSWIAVAVTFLAAWVWRELTVERPLIAVRLLAVPDIAWGNLLYVFTALGAFQSAQIAALLGQQPLSTGIGLGLSATGAAMLIAPINVIAGFIYPRLAGLSSQFGPRMAASVGAAAMAASFVGMMVWSDSVTGFVAMIALQMLGLGVVFLATPLVIVAACPSERVSECTGMMVVIRSVGHAIGAQIVLSMLSHHSPGTSFPAPSTWFTIFVYGTAMSLVAAFIALRLPKTLNIKD